MKRSLGGVALDLEHIEVLNLVTWNTFSGHFRSKISIKMKYLPSETYIDMTYFSNDYLSYLSTSKPDTLHICKTSSKWNLLQLK